MVVGCMATTSLRIRDYRSGSFEGDKVEEVEGPPFSLNPPRAVRRHGPKSATAVAPTFAPVGS